MAAEKKIEKLSQSELRAACFEAKATIQSLLRCREQLMPGAAKIAIQDYANLNDSGVAGESWVRRYG